MQTQPNLSQTAQKINAFSPEFIENFKTELATLSIDELSLKAKKLNYLLNELNPFEQENIPSELAHILEEFSMASLIENPYSFTNIALQMLDSAEAETKKRMN